MTVNVSEHVLIRKSKKPGNQRKIMLKTAVLVSATDTYYNC